MQYSQGLHILAEIRSAEIPLLSDASFAQTFYSQKVEEYGLRNLGQIFHNFDHGGFTGVICLSESHLSMHTWPEHGLITFDVFLSNFSRNNDAIGKKLFQDTLEFFKAQSYNVQEVRR